MINVTSIVLLYSSRSLYGLQM